MTTRVRVSYVKGEVDPNVFASEHDGTGTSRETLGQSIRRIVYNQLTGLADRIVRGAGVRQAMPSEIFRAAGVTFVPYAGEDVDQGPFTPADEAIMKGASLYEPLEETTFRASSGQTE